MVGRSVQMLLSPLVLGVFFAGCSFMNSASFFTGNDTKGNNVGIKTGVPAGSIATPSGSQQPEPISVPVDVTGVLLTAHCTDTEVPTAQPETVAVECGLQPVDSEVHQVKISGVSLRIERDSEVAQVPTDSLSGRPTVDGQAFLMSRDWPVRLHFKFPTAFLPNNGASKTVLSFESIELPERVSVPVLEPSGYEFMVKFQPIDIPPAVCEGASLSTAKLILDAKAKEVNTILPGSEFVAAQLSAAALMAADSASTDSEEFPLLRRTSLSAHFRDVPELQNAVVCSAQFSKPVKPATFTSSPPAPQYSYKSFGVYLNWGRSILYTNIKETLPFLWFHPEAPLGLFLSSNSFDQNFSTLNLFTLHDWCGMGASCSSNMGTGEVSLQNLPSRALRQLTQNLLSAPSAETELKLHFVEHGRSHVHINAASTAASIEAEIEAKRLALFPTDITAVDPNCPDLGEIEITYVK